MDVVPKLGFDSLLGNIPAYPEACSKSRVNPFIINRVISLLWFQLLLSLSTFLDVMQPDHANQPTQTYICYQSFPL